MIDFARLLDELKRRSGRSYDALARRAGASGSTLHRWCRGERVPPDFGVIERFARACGAAPAEIAELKRRWVRADVSYREQPDRSSDTTRPPQQTSVPAQLPADLASFTGRSKELRQLDDLLKVGLDGQVRPVVISAIAGQGGVGKTALAVHWAHRVRAQFPDGQFYLNLRGYGPGGPPMTVDDAIRGFLDAFNIPIQRIPVSVAAQVNLYRSLLAGKRVLVVLDNARDADQVRPLLPGAPGCMAIVTSRNRLTGLVAAEGAYPLALEPPTTEEARDLLVRRIGFDRVAAEHDAADHLISLCGRLPLALAIISAQASTHTTVGLSVLAKELSEARSRLDALTGWDATTNVRAVLSWSYHALSDDARRLFRQLALHLGPDIGAPAAASLAGAPLESVRPVLRELTRASLLTEHGRDRFVLHDLLRAYATELADCLDTGCERRAALHRALDHYLRTVSSARLLLNPQAKSISLPPPQPALTLESLADIRQAMDWLNAEYTVLLAAIRQAANTGFEAHAWQLAWSLGYFFNSQGHWHDGADSLRIALDAARRTADPCGQALVHSSLGSVYSTTGRVEGAEAHFREAIKFFEELGDHVGRGFAHLNFAFVFEQQERHDDALVHAKRALELFRIAGHRAGESKALNSVGWYHGLLGQHHRTVEYCMKALMLQRELGDFVGESYTLDSLAHALCCLGDHVQAITYYRQSVLLRRQLGDRLHEGTTLEGLGDAYLAASDPAAAREAWKLALVILGELGHSSATEIRAKLQNC